MNKITNNYRYGTFVYSDNDTYVGKSIDLYGEYSQKEVDFLLYLISENDTVVDVGANFGAITIPLASKAKKVISFEPQRTAFCALAANVFLNNLNNVFIYQKALGNYIGNILMHDVNYDIPGSYAGFSFVIKNTFAIHSDKVPIEMIQLDNLKLESCNLIKIDVEGMEKEVLVGAKKTIDKFQPMLYVENDVINRSYELITYIHSLGYSVYTHQPPLFNNNNYRNIKENIFEELLSLNLFCIPKSRKINEFKNYELKNIMDYLL